MVAAAAGPEIQPVVECAKEMRKEILLMDVEKVVAKVLVAKEKTAVGVVVDPVVVKKMHQNCLYRNKLNICYTHPQKRSKPVNY